jgi:DNA replication and repair protein RecF
VRIKRIALQNLRNHEITEIETDASINVFYGLNGAGKTTILEAIALCGFSKSFLPSSESALVNKNFDFYQARADAENDLRMPYFAQIKYSRGAKKELANSYGNNLYPKDIIGEMPLVILSPDFKNITFGSPQDRREFIDRILSQSYKSYFEDLLKYRKILKQRAALLGAKHKEGELDIDLFEIWTDMLIDAATRIIYRRAEFIKDFAERFKKIYSGLSADKEEADIHYKPFGMKVSLDKAEIKDKLTALAKKYREDEIRRSATLFGCHKDDIKITVNSGAAKEYASQGQHKTLLISLKFAEFYFLKDIKQETPIALLDDMFSELDELRIEQSLALVEANKAQTFITINNADSLKKILAYKSKSLFIVEDGKVRKEELS